MAFNKPKSPPKKGTITGTLQMKNLDIDGKTLMLIDDRVSTAQKMSLKVGDKILYRQLSQGIEKGKINFIAFDDGSADPVQQPAPTTNPESTEEKKPEPPETKIVQGEYLSHTAQSVTLKDCKGNAEAWRADIGILKFLTKPDCEVKAGVKVKALLVQQNGEWTISRLGLADPDLPDKPFRTGGEILEQNLKEKQAETAAAEAALAQINKENAEGDARISENQEYLKNITGDQKSMTPTEPTKEPEKCQPEAPVDSQRPREVLDDVIDAFETKDMIKRRAIYKRLTEELKEKESIENIPVELKVHLDCGSYSNFDLTVPGLPIDQAIAKVEGDAKKAIAMMHRLMADAKKGY